MAAQGAAVAIEYGHISSSLVNMEIFLASSRNTFSAQVGTRRFSRHSDMPIVSILLDLRSWLLDNLINDLQTS